MALLVSLMIVFLFSALSNACCPDGWLSYRRHCYLVGFGKFLSFIEAEHYCSQHGASLVQVDNTEENAFLKDYLRKTKADYTWLGLTDEAVQGIWRWYNSNQIPVMFDWASGEPNGASEHCVSFYDKADYKWADFSCGTKVQPLCEKMSPAEVNIPQVG